MVVIVIILTVMSFAMAFLAYGLVLRQVNERNEEREKFTQALQNQYRQFTAAKKDLIEERQQAHLRGRQEGKRDVLDWIKTQVDSGAMTVKINSTPKNSHKGSDSQ